MESEPVLDAFTAFATMVQYKKLVCHVEATSKVLLCSNYKTPV